MATARENRVPGLIAPVARIAYIFGGQPARDKQPSAGKPGQGGGAGSYSEVLDRPVRPRARAAITTRTVVSATPTSKTTSCCQFQKLSKRQGTWSGLKLSPQLIESHCLGAGITHTVAQEDTNTMAARTKSQIHPRADSALRGCVTPRGSSAIPQYRPSMAVSKERRRRGHTRDGRETGTGAGIHPR